MLTWFAQTTLVAAGLAALAFLAGRSGKLGPEGRHALWLVVLAKFLIPPIVAWPWTLPAWPGAEPAQVAVAPIPAVAANPARSRSSADPLPGGRSRYPAPGLVEHGPTDGPGGGVPTPATQAQSPPAPESAELPQVEPMSDPPELVATPPTPAIEPAAPEPRPAPELAATPPPPIARPAFPWADAALAAWLCGAVGVVARLAWRVARFRRSLVGSFEGPAWLVAEAATLGERLGVASPPIVLAPGVSTPLLWCLGRPRLILPASLVDRLAADRWPGILAHELAHLARRDHWVVRLELIAGAFWWWNPLFWLVRRRLHAEAELACDARVVRALPSHRFAYAETLVEVCERMARPSIPAPALGVRGPGAARSLETRLTMILRDPIPRRPFGRPALLTVALLAGLSLPAWTLGQQPEPSKPAEPARAPDAPKADPPPESPRIAPPPIAQAQADGAPLSIEAIRQGIDRRRAALKTIQARFVVWDRFETDGRSMSTADPQARVQVQVAEVSADLGAEGHDFLHAIAAEPGASGFAWSGILEGSNGQDWSSIPLGPDLKAPVPFRWRPAYGNRDQFVGSPTDRNFSVNGTNLTGIGRPYRYPLIAGDLGPLGDLSEANHRLSLAGSESIDGNRAVRVAWISQLDPGWRGLVWLAPDLGFAVIRFDSFYLQQNRRTVVRSKAEVFENGDGVWLPRVVKARQTQFRGDGRVVKDHEQVVQIEDVRVNRPSGGPTPDVRPPILGIDEKTGDFLTQRFDAPPGLVDRLARAVGESPFGPPANFEREAPPAAAAAGVRPAGPAQGRPAEPSVAAAKPPAEAPAAADVIAAWPFPPPKAATPAAEARPSVPPGAADKPVAEVQAADVDTPKPFKFRTTGGPAPAAGAKLQDDPDKARADAETARIRADPEVAALFAEVVEARNRYDELEPKEPAGRPANPDAANAKAKYDELVARYVKLREAKQAEADRPIDDPAAPGLFSDPRFGALLKEMGEAQAAFEGVRSKAHSKDNPAMMKAGQRLARVKAELAALLDARGPKLGDEPARARGDQAADQVALLQIRRDGKAAEVRKAEVQYELAGGELSRTTVLHQRNQVSQGELAIYRGKLNIAEAELAARKADMAEADLFLDQAKRRLGTPGPKRGPGAEVPAVEPSGGVPPSLVDARDAVELLEVQLAAKRSESVDESQQIESAKSVLDPSLSNGLGSDERRQEAKRMLRDATSRFRSAEAEVKVLGVRLNQARRRLADQEALFKRSSSPAPAGLGP